MGKPAGRSEPADPIREQLLEAAARVFATKGYAGTKIMDIVREAGLSSGAVYGRFASKDELLMQAVLNQVERNAVAGRLEGSIAEIVAGITKADTTLDAGEELRLEAFVAARREPKVASAIAKMRKRARSTDIARILERAVEEGLVDAEADLESLVYLVESLSLGLLVQRGAGQFPADAEAWERMVFRLLRSVAQPNRAAHNV